MELTQHGHGLLEELLAPRRDGTNWTNYPGGETDFFSNGWMFESFDDESKNFSTPNPPFLGLTTPTEPTFSCPLNGLYPYVDVFTVPEIDSSYHNNNNDTPPPIPFPIPIPIQQEQHPSMVEEEAYYDFVVGLGNDLHSLEERINGCKVEIEMESAATTINIPESKMAALCGEKKTSSRVKKAEGQPSKNLMAERRRRKRLNDRLLMLRSIVPKISKMDRTSILGDTIGYMKELLEKLKTLQQEEEEDIKASMNQVNLMDNCNELKPNEPLVRNSPKFNVERTDTNTRIEIRCAAKPGLLLSTINTLEALGINIQQCVISCFNDFSMQASCSEGMEQQMLISSEDIKQALYRNAGYGGRCL